MRFLWHFHGVGVFPQTPMKLHPLQPRGSQSSWEERRHKSFQAWAEEPLGTDSHRTISKWSCKCWLLIGHKKSFELLCSIDEQFSWVLFVSSNMTAISRHSCPVPSPCFPNQKRGDYWWVEKRFGCYQQEQFNLHWENSVSDGSQCIVNNRICWNFAITEAIMAGTNSLKWFLKKTPGTEKHKDKIKNVMALLRCHCNSDCNKTQIIRNFHLYVIQLWEPFFHIFTYGIVINAQIWEVSPQKKSSGATLRTQRLKFGI